jgi:uncharacterized protein
METIYIPQLLRAPDRTEVISLEEFVPGFPTLTPVRGKLLVRHGGTFLEVSLTAETIVTLTCDRCLQQYNQRLLLDTSELIWLDKEEDSPHTYSQEREIAWEDLSETLSPEGYFSPDTWLYEQLSLVLPLRRLCGKDCQPPATPASDSSSIDSRWSALKLLK